jgi:hypothetical protein
MAQLSALKSVSFLRGDSRNPPFAPLYKMGVGGISEIAFPYPNLLDEF